jgi:hypothetical protein
MTPTFLLAFYDVDYTLGDLAVFLIIGTLFGLPVWLPIVLLGYALGRQKLTLGNLFWVIAVLCCLLAWWHDREDLYWQSHWHAKRAAIMQQQSEKVLAAAAKVGFTAEVDRDGILPGLKALRPDPLLEFADEQ